MAGASVASFRPDMNSLEIVGHIPSCLAMKTVIISWVFATYLLDLYHLIVGFAAYLLLGFLMIYYWLTKWLLVVKLLFNWVHLRLSNDVNWWLFAVAVVLGAARSRHPAAVGDTSAASSRSKARVVGTPGEGDTPQRTSGDLSDVGSQRA